MSIFFLKLHVKLSCAFQMGIGYCVEFDKAKTGVDTWYKGELQCLKLRQASKMVVERDPSPKQIHQILAAFIKKVYQA